MKAGRLAIAATLTILSLPAGAADANWISDSNGCKVWDESPTPNETVNWSGACLDGYASGEGLLQWTVAGKPGSRYEGGYAEGKRNGKGTETYAAGVVLIGEFTNGVPVGQVVVTYPNGTRYVGGYWTRGTGTAKGVMTLANGERYEGEFLAGQWSGHGTATSADGARYEGGWLDGKRNGQGSQLYADGATYSGEWRDDKPTNPEAIKSKKYALSTDVTGSSLPSHNVSNLRIPPDKTYAQLTPEQKHLVKESYEKMAKDDEPPYPLHGTVGILRACEKLQHKLLVRGELELAVTVDLHGAATSVEVYKSPDPQMAQAMASVLMLEKYKPAICNGSPCQMKFPFEMKFHVDL